MELNLIGRCPVLSGRRAALAFTLALLATACGPSWQVVRESGPPSALANAGTVAVQFDYTSAIVEDKPMQEWIAGRASEDAEYPQTFADLLSKFETAYMEGMQNRWAQSHKIEPGAAAPEGAIVAHVRVQHMKLGKFIPFVLPPTVVRSTIVWETGGQETDEIILEGSQSPSLMRPSVFSHIGHVGKYLGAHTASFLQSKQP